MLDTHAVARSLTDAELTPAQVDAITAAVRDAADHGGRVAADQFAALDGRLDRVDARLDGIDGRLAALDAQVARVDARLDGIDGRLDRVDARLDRVDARLDRVQTRIDALIWGLAGAMIVQTVAIIGAVFALLRFFPAP